MSASRQVIRAAGRRLAQMFRRSGVEAGGGGRRWQGVAQLHNPTRAMDAARASARARAAATVLNTPQGARIVEQWVSALAGTGWQARSRHPDRDLARALNSEFEEMANTVLPVLARSVVVSGECFAHLDLRPGEGVRLRPVPMPAEQVDATLSRPLDNGGRIEQGIELDAEGEVVAYHVLAERPGSGFSPYETRRVPASDMLHIFDQLFPGQVRGLSWLAPVLLRLNDREQLSDALLMQAKVAAMMTGFIRDPSGGSAGFGAGTSDAIDVSLEPGAMRVIPPDADVFFTNPPQGLRQSVDYLAAIDREIASGVGLTYEMLTGDLAQANYSSARVGLLDFRRRAEALQRRLIEGQFLRPLWRRWIEVRQLAGDLPADDDDLFAVRFIGPGFAWIDPEKEVNAEIAAIAAGLKSREEVVAARGRDIDELDEEIARDRQRTGSEVSA